MLIIPFFDHDFLIDRSLADRIDNSARPSDFNTFYLRRAAQTEMDAQVVLRVITTAASQFANLRALLGDYFDARPNAAAVRFDTLQFDRDPVVARLHIASQ